MKISTFQKTLIALAILIAIVIAGIFIAKPDFLFATKTTETETIETKNIEWALYQNERFGYEVKYPQGWTVDADRYEGTSTQIVSLDENVWIITSVIGDSRLTEENGFETVIAEIEEGLRQDPLYQVDVFEKEARDTEYLVGGYSTGGSFRESSGKTYHFEEMGILMKEDSGLVYVITVHVPNEKTAEYQEFIDEVVASFLLTAKE